MFGSSCRLVRTSNDSSNILVKSLTALLISSIPDVMALVHCSLTLEELKATPSTAALLSEGSTLAELGHFFSRLAYLCC